MFGARQITLSGLLPYYDYVIATDELTVPPNAGTSLTGTYGNESPDVTVLAGAIQGFLQIKCAGRPGADGADGEAGESGSIDEPEGPEGGPDGTRRRPTKTFLPGGNGGNGGDGEDGGAGGVIRVHYASAAQTPTGTAPGGPGGRGGKGGPGGPGRPPGKAGRPGKPGKSGGPGTVEIRQVGTVDLWKTLDAASGQAWAAYRAEVAGFLFRKFDFGSQLAALRDWRSASSQPLRCGRGHHSKPHHQSADSLRAGA